MLPKASTPLYLTIYIKNPFRYNFLPANNFPDCAEEKHGKLFHPHMASHLFHKLKINFKLKI